MFSILSKLSRRLDGMLAELRGMSGANESDKNERNGENRADSRRYDFAPEGMRRQVVVRGRSFSRRDRGPSVP
jgi:hypothetical protein